MTRMLSVGVVAVMFAETGFSESKDGSNARETSLNTRSLTPDARPIYTSAADNTQNAGYDLCFDAA